MSQSEIMFEKQIWLHHDNFQSIIVFRTTLLRKKKKPDFLSHKFFFGR